MLWHITWFLAPCFSFIFILGFLIKLWADFFFLFNAIDNDCSGLWLYFNLIFIVYFDVFDDPIGVVLSCQKNNILWANIQHLNHTVLNEFAVFNSFFDPAKFVQLSFILFHLCFQFFDSLLYKSIPFFFSLSFVGFNFCFDENSSLNHSQALCRSLFK